MSIQKYKCDRLKEKGPLGVGIVIGMTGETWELQAIVPTTHGLE